MRIRAASGIGAGLVRKQVLLQDGSGLGPYVDTAEGGRNCGPNLCQALGLASVQGSS